MANVINDVANEITDALDEVLPGRSTAEPRTENVGPSLWVEMPTVTTDNPSRPKYTYLDFPVWIIADGADRAQVAFLNDCVAKAWDALARVPLCTPVSSRPAPTEQGANRAVVLTVRRITKPTGFCLPDAPGESPIPPDPITEPVPESEED